MVRVLSAYRKGAEFMHRSRLWICGSALVCCLAMALVDGVLQPGYFIKSAIKILLFLLVPILLASTANVSLKAFFRPDKASLLTGGILGLVTFGVILGAYAILGDLLDLSAVPAALEAGAGVTKDNFLFVGTYIALCNSLLEEFFFRGFLFTGLKRNGSAVFAYVFSAAAFALYHGGMLIAMVPPVLFLLALAALFFCGLLFDYLDSRKETLYISWLLHMGANLAINAVGMLLLTR